MTNQPSQTQPRDITPCLIVPGGVNMLVYILIIHEPCVHHKKKGGLPSRDSRSELPTSADPSLLLSGGPNGNKNNQQKIDTMKGQRKKIDIDQVSRKNR